MLHAKCYKILKVPIFSVVFGRGADFDLLKGISESNNGFVKRVYEDGDASLQLEDFYSLISSPQITDLEFNYQGIEENSLSNRELATFFEGGQFVVTGKIEDGKELSLTITGNKNEGKYSKRLSSCDQIHLRQPRTTKQTCHWKYICSSDIRLRRTNCRKQELERAYVCKPSCARRRKEMWRSCKALFCRRRLYSYWTNKCPRPALPATRPPSSCLTLKQIPPRSEAQEFMQRLHSFLNIKQLMKKEKLEEAKEIALRSNFVTPLTSLVVVKPCEGEGTSDLEEASARESSSSGLSGQKRRGYSSPSPSPSPSFNRRGNGKSKLKKRGRSPSRMLKRDRKRKKQMAIQRGRQSHSTTFQKRRKMSKNRKATGKNRKGAKPMIKKNLRKKSKKVAPSRQKIRARIISSEESGNGPKEGSAGGVDLSTLTCSLSLYERTYHRGTKLTTTESERDLGKFSVASAELVGRCCWILYKDRNWR